MSPRGSHHRSKYAKSFHEWFCVLSTPEQNSPCKFAFLSYRFHSASLRHKHQTGMPSSHPPRCAQLGHSARRDNDAMII